MRIFVELEDYELHEWVLHNVSEDPTEITRSLESALGIYLQRMPAFALEGRALMRVELLKSELGHRLKIWWDANPDTLPYRLICDECYGYTTVTDIRYIGGRTFSFMLG